jgi:hypothetical protein
MFGSEEYTAEAMVLTFHIIPEDVMKRISLVCVVMQRSLRILPVRGIGQQHAEIEYCLLTVAATPSLSRISEPNMKPMASS